VVTTVAVSLCIDGDHELQARGELGEDRRGVVPPDHNVAQRTAQLVEDGGSAQEVAHPCGKAGEYLRAEVVDNEPVGCGHGETVLRSDPVAVRLESQ
jgi:hypothetical protein